MKPYNYMQLALNEAKRSGKDIPVGCIIEHNGEIIASCHNEKEEKNNPVFHAEIIAIEKAASFFRSWRLTECNLYVTLEPCPMCAWAILNSRIKAVYFGAYDTNYGALGSKLNLVQYSVHKPDIYGGIMEKESELIINDYFKKLRQNGNI